MTYVSGCHSAIDRDIDGGWRKSAATSASIAITGNESTGRGEPRRQTALRNIVSGAGTRQKS